MNKWNTSICTFTNKNILTKCTGHIFSIFPDCLVILLQDTLEEFSLNDQKDPVNRMLKKLQSHFQPRFQLTSDPSEGEVVMADTLVMAGEEINISK